LIAGSFGDHFGRGCLRNEVQPVCHITQDHAGGPPSIKAVAWKKPSGLRFGTSSASLVSGIQTSTSLASHAALPSREKPTIGCRSSKLSCASCPTELSRVPPVSACSGPKANAGPRPFGAGAAGAGGSALNMPITGCGLSAAATPVASTRTNQLSLTAVMAVRYTASGGPGDLAARAPPAAGTLRPMRPGVWTCTLAIVLVAGCYSPSPPAGAPCNPGPESCPSGQTCELVAGAHICVGSAPDTDPAGPWRLVQTRDSEDQRRVTVAATGAAHLIVVAVETNAGAVTSVTDDAGTTYVQVPGSRAVVTNGGFGVELWYAASSSAGATTINAVADNIHAMVAWEVAGIRTASPLDTASKLDDQPPTTSPTGASVTTSAAGELVISVAIVANEISGLATGSPFTNDHTTFGNGWAHLTSATAPAGTYQARWNQPDSGTYCATSAAFFAAP
jgi:hypothetical protein